MKNRVSTQEFSGKKTDYVIFHEILSEIERNDFPCDLNETLPNIFWKNYLKYMLSIQILT